MAENKRVLSVLAHPDDAEFVCAGTLVLLYHKGWEVHIATMTPGDCGSAELGREEIAAIRRKEAAQSAAILGGVYHCLECEDGYIRHDRETLHRTVELIRSVRPRLIFAASPSDYLYDHEVTSLIVRDAAFWSGVPNLVTPGAVPLTPVPHVYYCDPLDGADIFGEPVQPGIIVDITSSLDTKAEMLSCHASQRDWLRRQHGTDEYIGAMKEFGGKRGVMIGRPFGEGFRQHLGNAYPADNMLARELGDLVHRV